ncbi:hypothetical protein GCM10027290_34870 [Micromonospora sonneratiae]
MPVKAAPRFAADGTVIDNICCASRIWAVSWGVAGDAIAIAGDDVTPTDSATPTSVDSARTGKL